MEKWGLIDTGWDWNWQVEHIVEVDSLVKVEKVDWDSFGLDVETRVIYSNNEDSN